jgi:mRNA turnover protein 4
MVRGVPSLDTEHVVVKEGDKLSAEQAQILKLVGIKMGEFRVQLRYCWEKSTGEVKEIEDNAGIMGNDDDGEGDRQDSDGMDE